MFACCVCCSHVEPRQPQILCVLRALVCPALPGHPSHTQVNYRTHSGILEVASSVVDALRRFFPQHIDHLDRERALFPVRQAPS